MLEIDLTDADRAHSPHSLISPLTRKFGRLWLRYSVEEIFRKAVIGRNGRERAKNTRCSFHYNYLILGEMAHPERFGLPAFWFVGGSQALQQTTAADESERNQQQANPGFGWCRTLLYGQLHGRFRRRELSHLPEINAGRDCDERAHRADDIRAADRVVMPLSPDACR